MPDDMKAVVERVEAAATIANGFGGTTASVSLTDLRTLLSALRQRDEALRLADQFITNGIELGFIRMPDADCSDPAHDTPRIIRAILTGSETNAR